ncbi:hypothetical protein I5M32_11770 [Pedobacter sp. SD-b]|uniref:Uncharacterized protein n=1 Tax=Pedobacter segetis TaxID=2793069 RepID=A0ABS1BMV0_9SPHI|nr:hypothetical protein [Pedobacter segetis]MBK0383636.1 hypothetical protein [Pedobacter segetis]
MKVIKGGKAEFSEALKKVESAKLPIDRDPEYYKEWKRIFVAEHNKRISKPEISY